VVETGSPVHPANGMTVLGREEGAAKYHVVSGTYEFTSEYSR
jgi:hypothetical protein